MDYRKEFLVTPGKRLSLADIPPTGTGGYDKKKAARKQIASLVKRLAERQQLLYAEGKHAILIVLQAMDAGGKDGTIRHCFSALNPQGTRVASFKVPTTEELAHDFLWRIHRQTPARGEIVIFNRSHYEDVLVTRVHGLITQDVWTERYERIRQFEATLADNNTTILKFFLHISKEEQLERFEQRLDDPGRNWKISESDYAERHHWDTYQAAYEDALSATSTDNAPWYVIPADHKWFRNLAISEIVSDTIDELNLAYPAPSVDLAEIRQRYHAALEAQRADERNSD
jgi:PPK2 family polyphosphate:nucleotide phosphotransferase